MRVPSIYLETTIFNFPFVDDAPQYREETLKLFEEIKAGKFKPYTSRHVIEEIQATKTGELKEKMLALVSDFSIDILNPDMEEALLARAYLNAGIIPEKYRTDAMHIANATVAGLDMIVSLNFKHIVKHKTIVLANATNVTLGYKNIFIYSPAEVIENDEDI